MEVYNFYEPLDLPDSLGYLQGFSDAGHGMSKVIQIAQISELCEVQEGPDHQKPTSLEITRLVVLEYLVQDNRVKTRVIVTSECEEVLYEDVGKGF